MAKKGIWLDKEKKRIRELWEKSGKDREKFKKLCQSDPILSGKGAEKSWNACEHMARSLGFFEEENTRANLTMVEKLEKKDPEKVTQLKKDLANPNFSWADIKERYGYTSEQLEKYILKFKVTVNKSKNSQMIFRDFQQKLAETVKSGALNSPGLKGILNVLSAEFEAVTAKMTLDSFTAQVMEIVWDKTTLDNLENCMRLDILSDFYTYNKHIPKQMIDEKVRELRGKSTLVQSVSFKNGLGRILDESSQKKDEKFKLPESTFKRPFKINTENKSSWSISFPNAVHIGTLYNPLMKENPLWRTFVDAEANHDPFLFLTNIIDLDTTKASGSATKIYRSLFSGLNVNLEIIDPDYRAKAAAIIEDSPDDMVLYETIAERFQEVMSGLKKILNHDPNNSNTEKIQYTGKIYVVLTKGEQDVVAKAAYMEVRYATLCQIANLNVIKSMLTQQVARKEATQAELNKLLKEIARTIISLIHSQEDRRFYNRVLALVVRQIEKALGPNCQVIGMGNSYVEINGQLGELNIPESETVTDEHLKKYVSVFGAKSYLGQMPDFAVVLPSYPLCARNGERERYVEGRRLMPTKIWVAPPLVDGKFLRRASNNNARTVHNLAKAVNNFQFQPGLLRLEFNNGDINSRYLSIGSLAGKKTRKDSRETYQGKFLCLKFGTDPHWGGRSKVYIEDKENRRSLGMAEASMEMERRGKLFQPGKMRVHGFHMLDDGIQARNYETQYEPSPNQMSNVEMEKYLAEIDDKIQNSNDLKQIKTLSTEKDSLIRNQLNLRGSDYPKHQMDDVFKRHIEPNIDFFHALISQGEDAGIKYEGISEITDTRVDRRDIGAVTYPNGNHFAHTVWGAVTEGEFYAQKLQDKLKALDRWRKDPALIDKLVRAPIHSSEYFALGRIVLPGGYKYGVDFRGTPPRFASWADTLLGWVRSDIFTGDMEGHMSGYFTIGACGDKHFFASTYVSYKFYHMSGSGSHTDQYGKKGFSPNNTGVSFVLLPVDGPENGPIITRTFSATFMENYFKKPFDFDWETCLPNTL